MRPDAEIDACREGHRRLLDSVMDLGEERVRQPSLLPDWSRAHVIAHLTRKSESHVWLFEGALTDETREQALAPSMRPEHFAATTRCPASDLVSDLSAAFDRVEEAFAALPDKCWDRVAILTAGRRTMADVVLRHLRDVEVHHVDLDVGYSPRSWPTVFVEAELDRRLRGLPDRADHADLLAWLLDRAPVPKLGPW